MNNTKTTVMAGTDKAEGTNSEPGNPEVLPGSAQNAEGTTKCLFIREDWTLFRTLTTIAQKAGVSPNRLRRLVVKELADNALDVCGTCRIGELPDGGFYVEDDGPGIDGSPEDIAWLFSIKRALASSKMIRRPSRGALGNGLRVVAGVAFASGGAIVVISKGRRLKLIPQESGETAVEWEAWDWHRGTRVEVRLGDSVPKDANYLSWAQMAIDAAGNEPIYKCKKTSPYFYDSDAFFEFLHSAGHRTIEQVIAEFDGCTGKAAKLTSQFLGRRASSLSHEESETILRTVRAKVRPVTPNRLNLLGSVFSDHYAKDVGVLYLKPGRGSVQAELPYSVEAWLEPSEDDDDHIDVLVNRTPVTGSVDIQRKRMKADVAIFGCGLQHIFTVGRRSIDLTLNVQIPYMPITSDGKEPDLTLFLSKIRTVVEKAAKKCQSANRSNGDRNKGLLPSLPKGRPGEEAREQYAVELKQFADLLKQIKSTVDFKVSSRGWCYILENDHGLSKGEFGKAEKLINDCRKCGYLPIDFTVEDEARRADNLESCDNEDPAQYASVLAQGLRGWSDYAPGSFWDNQPVYIQMVVEKIDLKYLFLPVCQQYRVPIINARGWSDLNLRAGLMRRFQEHEREGRQPVLLYCGDHDPVGLQIDRSLPEQFNELEPAVGWSPGNMAIERFGLNSDFIETHKLTWIEGLQTGSGKDLGDSNHKMHNATFVQEYIAKHGKRKVEANALVVRPEAGRQLCRDAIERHLDLSAIADYEQSLIEPRKNVRTALPQAVKRFLDDLRDQAA